MSPPPRYGSSGHEPQVVETGDGTPVRPWRSARRATALLTAATVVALAACTATSDSSATPTPTSGSPAPAADWEGREEELSPLIIAALAPDPIPVLGSDELVHVAYELTVLNFSPRPAIITSVEIVGADGVVAASLDQDEVAARTVIVADYGGADPEAELSIPSGKTALLVLDAAYPDREAVPASLAHRISASFGSPESGDGGIAVLFPEEVTQTGGTVIVSDEEPPVIGAPLRGTGWLVGNGCCTLNAHRNVILPAVGRINGAERFALDVSMIDVDQARQTGYDASVEIDGDPSLNESFRAYGADVLAVGDGTVVAVHTTDPDTPPGELPLGPGFTVANLGGNSVVLELAPDLFAVYFHLAPDSPTVRVGDRVARGDVIAQLGNAGNTSAAHLHFQLSRTPHIFASDSVPYVIDEFTVVGSIDPETVAWVDGPDPGPRRDALPLALTVVDFE